MDLFEIAFGLYIGLCTVSLPLWAWIKWKRRALSFTLFVVPVLCAYLLFGYLNNPKGENDHGIAIAGLLLIAPLLSFVVQFLVYSVLAKRARAKGVESA